MKRVILGLAALVLSAATCQAGTVTATFNGLQGGTVVSDGSGNGGVFNWTPTNYSGAPTLLTISSSPGGIFQTFCIETTENIYGGGSYVYNVSGNSVSALAAAPTAKAMGSAAATNLQLLFGKFGTTTFNNTGVDLGAMQLAIWTIVDGSLALSPTLAGANIGNPTVVIDANAYLAYVAANQSGPQASYLVALTNIGNQDQLGIISTPGGGPGPNAPEPASMTLLGIGIAGMVGYRWRRRKLASA